MLRSFILDHHVGTVLRTFGLLHVCLLVCLPACGMTAMISAIHPVSSYDPALAVPEECIIIKLGLEAFGS